MSEREFDAYLKLLSGLLRLAPGQREQIAGELRDHMEERLDALLAAGVSREEAIGQALEEFGDVAALAASFRQIAWNRKRRWIMRWTAASVVGVLAIILAASVFWPSNQPGSSMFANAHAQDGEQESPAFQSSEDRNAETRTKLAQRGDCDITSEGVPLNDAMHLVSEQFDIQFHFDLRELELAAIEPDSTTVGLQLYDIRGDMMLDLLLDPVECGYYVRDGVVIVTSRERADSELLLRVYDCTDLIAIDPVYSQEVSNASLGEEADLECGMTQLGSGSATNREELSLVELILKSTGNLGNKGWLDEGTGAGVIYRYNNNLVINQTEAVHVEIESLLESLRRSSRSDARE